MRIVLATDAWEPQVNGVVRTLTRTIAECRAMGHEVEVIEPSQFKTIPCPTYPEIRLALGAEEEIRERLRAFEPEAVHIATGLHRAPGHTTTRPIERTRVPVKDGVRPMRGR